MRAVKARGGTGRARARGADEARRVDFCVIGSGIAGLSYALDAAELGEVAIVTKARAFDASTSYAQGGISAVVDKLDSVEEHVKDTCVAGGFLCDESAVRAMVEDSKEAVEHLIARGTKFTRDERGELHLAREGGHSRHRIVHADDMTGKEIERALLEAAKAHPNITFYEYHFAMELLRTRDGERCAGALVVDETRGTTKAFVASTTVLACGGAGHLFPSTTNPMVCTGDGIAMATRAGVTVANMEFMQFHPTALYTGVGGAAKLSPNENAFLITEAVRGHGGRLYNVHGERFMSRYDEREELAPRDVVARSIDSEMKRTESPCVFLDITHVDPDEVRLNFPGVAAELDRRGLDMTTERVPVVPAAHYMCGGVSTNENGETSLRGLFACGEVAYTGVHGANRLASNSLLEGIVFARRAVRSVGHDTWERELRHEIQRIMWNAAGIVRTTAEMEHALGRLNEIAVMCDERASSMKGYTMALAEISNLLVAGRLMLRCALMRKESRGLHYTLDHPDSVEAEKRPTLICEDKESAAEVARIHVPLPR
ncbi:FAD binding domain-domain-containing protein [Ostreococcus tauri]|uniref:L-aspartate oxidase n=1 Tax=Ostreococcus tauri TaxID=70448 RepID=A0A1Y5IIQ3_OSTTA|nr:FAD binding domain-domain-containing protein [Ostreococcus tauri]